MNKWLGGLALCVAAGGALAQPAAGEYVSGGGWGTLRIEPGGKFAIDSLGANGHSCGLEGTLAGRVGRTQEEPVCRIELTPRGDHWSLGIAERDFEACRNYCGARASFDGEYWRQLPACSGKGLDGVKAAFIRQYQGKQFDAAAATLESLFSQCGQRIFQPVEQNLRNDLALAYHHAGKDAECRRVLQPIADWYVPEPTVVTFAPADEDWGLPLVKKTRFNWKLCGGGAITQK
jgi:hypothetical protein